jgi:hypothetical protein
MRTDVSEEHTATVYMEAVCSSETKVSTLELQYELSPQWMPRKLHSHI